MFDAEATWLAANALFFYALALIPLMGLEVTARTFYALRDTWTPVLAGGVQIVFMWGLSMWFSQRLFPLLGWAALGGVALGFTVSNFLEVGLLLLLLRRKIGGINGRVLLDGFWRMGLAGGGMAGAAFLMARLLAGTNLFLQLLAGSLAGGVVYVGLCYLFRLAELRRVMEYGRERLKR